MELFNDNLIQERTVDEILSDAFTAGGVAGGVSGATNGSTGGGETNVGGTQLGGTIIGGAYYSNSQGARVEIFPETDTTIGFASYDVDGVSVFKTIISGTDIGDVILGNYAGGQGAKWDQSAGTFDIAGSLSAVTIDIGGADATSFHVDTNGNMWLGAATYNILTNPFAVSNAGVLRAVSGTIGGWTLSTTALSTGAFDTLNTMYFGTSGLSLSNVFKVTSAGVLTAYSGSVGGFTMTSNSLYAGADYSRIELNTSNGIHLGATNFNSAPFRVALDGTLTATNANITGVINASSGTIGGFTIGATKLYGGIIQTGENVGAGSNGVIMDTLGLRGYSATLGQVFSLPTDGSAPIFASGVINSTIFNVNTNAVIQTATTVGDGSALSAGILINNTGLYACEANQTLANANVKILIDGSAVIKMNVKGGQTDYNTGTGYFLGLSGGDYKFSIGNPAGNYMTWDGTYLKLKGSFDVGTGGLINNSVYTVATLPVAPTIVGYLVPSSYE